MDPFNIKTKVLKALHDLVSAHFSCLVTSCSPALPLAHAPFILTSWHFLTWTLFLEHFLPHPSFPQVSFHLFVYFVFNASLGITQDSASQVDLPRSLYLKFQPLSCPTTQCPSTLFCTVYACSLSSAT